MKKCSIEGCERKHRAKGFCGAHYNRMYRNGDPLAGRTSQGEPLRYLESVLNENTNDCVKWPYAHTSAGYATLKIDGKMQGAHRVICERVHGKPQEDDMVAAHSCGNEWCINPKHLRWATWQENSHDRLKHGTTSLNPEMIKELQAKIDAGHSLNSLAKEYPVSYGSIHRLKERAIWQLVS